ncbi:hypothetical protein LJC15_04135 [Desulfovibrio sp. OttesenSCG-928-G11]|nr:hypothetical protein [Desulfovibrio sp. OttesenSCG-928-G11]
MDGKARDKADSTVDEEVNGKTFGAAAGFGRLLPPALFKASALLGFISIVLLSFNAFPYSSAFLPYPERPAYLFSLAGLLCYALSLRWTVLLNGHRTLLLLVAAFLLYGFLITLRGALHLDPQGGLTLFSLLNYTLRKALPTLYILWFAGMLLNMDEKKRAPYFFGALIVMFIPNALHMVLENLANAGWEGLREHLVEVNVYFRQVNTSHGNWPPPYYTDRVRGLFAEPSHLAYAVIPLLGYCFHRVRQSVAALLAIALLAVSFFCKIPTVSGILALGLFSLAFVLRLPFLTGKRPFYRIGLPLLLGAALTSGALFHVAGQSPSPAQRVWALAGAMTDYAFDQAGAGAGVGTVTGPASAGAGSVAGRDRVESLLAEGAASSRFFTRLVCLRMESAIALRQPLGCGFYLAAPFWSPLRLWEDRPEEIFRYINAAFARPFPVIPHLCEYSALASDLGLPGLGLFLLLCLFIGVRAYKSWQSQDRDLLFYMLAALAAFMLVLCSLALKSGFMFYYFLGFLYALSEAGRDGPQRRAITPTSNIHKGRRDEDSGYRRRRLYRQPYLQGPVGRGP